MFDLDKSITQWGEALKLKTSESEVAELRDHLECEISHLRQAGKSEEDAFFIAAKKIGHADKIACEFYKNNLFGQLCYLPWQLLLAISIFIAFGSIQLVFLLLWGTEPLDDINLNVGIATLVTTEALFLIIVGIQLIQLKQASIKLAKIIAWTALVISRVLLLFVFNFVFSVSLLALLIGLLALLYSTPVTLLFYFNDYDVAEAGN